MELDYGFEINSHEKTWLKFASFWVVIFLLTFLAPDLGFNLGNADMFIYPLLLIIGLVTVLLSPRRVKEDEFLVFEFRSGYYVLGKGRHFIFPYFHDASCERRGTYRLTRIDILDSETAKYLDDYGVRINVELEYKIIDPVEYVKEFANNTQVTLRLHKLFKQKINSFLINLPLKDFKTNLNNINLSVVLAQSFDVRKDAYKDSELWQGLKKDAGIEVTGLIMDIAGFQNIDPFSHVKAKNYSGIYEAEKIRKKIEELDKIINKGKDTVEDKRERMIKEVESEVINIEERLQEKVKQTKAAKERFNDKEVERLKKEYGENDPKVWAWLAAKREQDEREIQRILDDN
jgi:hypothetical protein